MTVLGVEAKNASTIDLPAWHPGMTIGRYSLLAKIAVGGMAEIWLARQAGPRGFEKVVVVKRIVDSASADPMFVEMFLDEARIAAQLNHPNIVQIYDLGEESGAYYIAMEYLHGENLASVLSVGNKVARPLPVTYGVRLVAAAAEGLAHAHSMVGRDGKPLGIVHRDVSPQNLIVTYDGNLKIVDFGIAKAANRLSQTIGNQLKGKMGYLSPEQVKDGEVDERSDVFALGIVLFEVVTGTRLFVFDDLFKAIAGIAGQTPIPKASERNPDVPPALDAIIDRALARSKAERFQTARNFQVALTDWLRKEPEVPDAMQIAGYMQGLFHHRINERLTLIETPISRETSRASSDDALTEARPGTGDMTEAARSPGSLETRAGKRVIPTDVLTRDSLVSSSVGVDSGIVTVAATSTDVESRIRRVSWGRPAFVVGALVMAVLLATVGLFWGLEEEPEKPLPPRLAAPTKAEPVKAEPNVAETKEAEPNKTATNEAEPSKAETTRTDTNKTRVTFTKKPLVRRTNATVEPKLPPPSPPPKPPDESPRAARLGVLTVDARPFVRVFLGPKELIGSSKREGTPVQDVKLPEGTHELRLENREKGISAKVPVMIQGGSRSTYRYDCSSAGCTRLYNNIEPL